MFARGSERTERGVHDGIPQEKVVADGMQKRFLNGGVKSDVRDTRCQ